MTEEAYRRTIKFYIYFRMLGFSMKEKDICWALFNVLDVVHYRHLTGTILAERDGILYVLTFNEEGKLIKAIEAEADNDN